ncbi:hypothetical protein MesoLj131a_28990 [Mesorhizobium sp. 131-2-1]|nr:hypothetical protein MesoLj131a_28990 [Mesorhizobium sp. 131-2-1]
MSCEETARKISAHRQKPAMAAMNGGQPDAPSVIRISGPAAYPAPISALNTPITLPRRDGAASDSAQTSPST